MVPVQRIRITAREVNAAASVVQAVRIGKRLVLDVLSSGQKVESK